MFVAVLDHGSFARAAEHLGHSSGQASKLVARLEADLGVQLIKRTTRALTPTEAGLAFYHRLKALIEDFDTLEASVRNVSGRPTGRVRLTAPVTFGVQWLTPVLLRFAESFPEIQLDVSYSDRLANLVEEGFDLAIRIGQPMDSGLSYRHLCEARMVTVASPAYLAAHPAPQVPAEVQDHACIIDANFRDTGHWHFSLPLERNTFAVPVQGRLRLSNGEACLAACLAGYGIVRLPSFIAGPALREGKVQRILAEYDGPPLAIHALYPASKGLALKVRSLLDFLVAQYRESPEWDRGW